MRDFYLPHGGPSRLTPRRLMVLILALPPESPFWRSYQAAQERAMKPTPEQIRERARYYEQRAKEAASDG